MTKILKLSLGSAASVVALVVASGAALASGPVVYVEPEVMVAPMPAPQYSWEGFYGGLSYSSVRGHVDASGTIASMDNDTGPGAFVGYNWQRGNVVFGGELNYTDFDTPYPGFINRQRNALELRGRVGYAANNVLFYGFVGAARSEIFGSGSWNNQSGHSYGLGVQYHITRGAFVGLEAVRREVGANIGGVQADTQIDSVAFRLGYQF
ncbi:outer membrane protein [Pararhodobacter zhoushanensis]|uniref:outer membrane protein n=1 Tax=Pararhodobacter zhoushanensis TaxID=2479545 RepID=UPI000F8E8816|nr:outer membrane beta-barrel protein [Pararhodobacter zhoushanensis]